MANTKRRSIRIEDEIWDAAKERADEEHRTVSDVIRIALLQYAADQYDARAKRRVKK